MKAQTTLGASRKAAMAARIHAGTPVGLLGYLAEEPVAWCSIAPRSSYRRLVSGETSDTGIWAIACFFVVRRPRDTVITRQLIAAAVRHARAHGAAIVEAYPVEPDSPSYRFMGFVPVFEKAGFTGVGREGAAPCDAVETSRVREVTPRPFAGQQPPFDMRASVSRQRHRASRRIHRLSGNLNPKP
jgi:GNAT superfamily N-acetyltransferase